MNNISIKKDEYILKIIHDLNPPIIAQITALESFLNTSVNKISQEEKDLIELTLHSCNYMQKIIEIFNSVHKLNYEPLKLNYEKFDIIEIIKECIKEKTILLKYYDSKLELNLDKKIIINADKFQIKRVIENFLANSINYAFKNTAIKINGNLQNKNFIFKIKNESQYIDPTVIKEIFQKTETQVCLYNKNAVGLGLYLSRKIIQAHQGNIIVKSNLDNKNIFGFEIPID